MNLKEREGLTKLTSEGWGVLKEEIVKEKGYFIPSLHDKYLLW